MPTRRTFLLQTLPAASLAMVLARVVRAEDPLLAESDPDAIKLSYVADASKVDKARHPSYAAGQRCDTCELYNPPANSATGACSLIKGKQVAGAGWCDQYVP
ncbi:high-potential iron-sulfur protein [Amantichitinum ursilacus]|uniref:High-potential iron-sulfur protein n=1 Tax=Amantichitinum ursilacus TaxID=857265 RepID=A0A0N1JSY5_9NEIS|nr:high-potential iron-sulfur protein [Amantichitinum ursilacus]KPC53357.1 High-potential iron-sulfur protein [Amantichitinum ursilacus]